MPEGASERITNFLKGMKEVYGDRLRVISGMAQGIDTMAALAAIKLDIPFIAAVPWVGFAANWPTVHRDSYLDLLEKAEHVHIVCDTQEYKPWVYQKRDEWMVDNSDLLTSAWDGIERGGTWNTIKYARKIGRQDRIAYLFEGP